MNLFTIGWRLTDVVQSRNAFKILGVSRIASDAEIRKAYKVGVIGLHPDRNQHDPLAEDKFVDFKQAYDQLLNSQYRDVYDKWGEAGTKWLEDNKTTEDIFIQGVMRLAIQYGFLFGMTFLATFMADDSHARPISFTILLFFLSIEASLRFEDTDIVVPFVPWFAVHQIVALMIQSYYTIITGVIAFQNLTYKDPQVKTLEMLQVLILQQKNMQHHLLDLDQFLSHKVGRKKIKSTEAEGEGDINTSLPRNLRAKIRGNQVGAQPPRQKGSGIPKWVFMIGIYFFINYFMK